MEEIQSQSLSPIEENITNDMMHKATQLAGNLIDSYNGDKLTQIKKALDYLDVHLGLYKPQLKNFFNPYARDVYDTMYYTRHIILPEIYRRIEDEGPIEDFNWN
jgi:hypothetical protein